MKPTTFFTSVFAGVALALSTVHGLAADAAVASADKSFIQDAYQDGLAEIKMGALAEGKTATPDVKAFAAQMITDHGQANGELKTLADSKKVSTSSDPT